MTRRPPKNVAASVRQRLLDRARAEVRDFQLILKHFAIERLLYRLQQLGQPDRFVLKGAMLFRVWEGRSARQTQDLDLLGFGDPNAMAAVFREVARLAVEPEDGLRFDAASVRATPIRDQTEYRGVRVRLRATLDSARIGTQIDVGFGDVVTPAPQEQEYPSLLDLPPPRIRMYPRETVVAEKLQAMVSLGTVNTRVKDYYDLWHLARRYDFEGATLSQAVHNTFERRRTQLPDTPPPGLSESYLGDPGRARQWAALVERIESGGGVVSLHEAGAVVTDFALPATRKGFSGTWHPGGPWKGSNRA